MDKENKLEKIEIVYHDKKEEIFMKLVTQVAKDIVKNASNR